MVGGVVWLGVVGIASLAGVAVWLDAVRQALRGEGLATRTATGLLRGVASPLLRTKR
jgi:hypothetical protein